LGASDLAGAAGGGDVPFDDAGVSEPLDSVDLAGAEADLSASAPFL
jgi:hypothetical protein